MTRPAKSTLIGPLMMVGLPGLNLDNSTRRLLEEYHVGNFILFKRNVDSPGQLEKLCRELRQACADNGLGSPLIAIDQEGGTVSRLPEPFTRFADARAYAESADPPAALTRYARTCSRELAAIGVNMNLAPVLDICPAGRNFFMERRVLGNDPDTVARLGSLVVREFQNNGIAACAKHFPGLGAARLDPHEKLPCVELTEEDLAARDLVPFRQAIKDGVAAVMTSHTIYTGLDPANPATLSPKILTSLLRAKLAYQGVIITDDLEMGAIENERPVARAALGAFEAGADMLLICHEHEKVRAAIDTMTRALERGSITQSRITETRERIDSLRKAFAV